MSHDAEPENEILANSEFVGMTEPHRTLRTPSI